MKFLRSGLLAALLFPAGHALGESVVCHATYGGETRAVVAEPIASPYGVGNVAMGSYFQMRVVFQKTPADLAAIKVYTFADRDEGMTPIHQATYPYPPLPAGRYGFTGLHFVYEPVRDGELQYWCEMAKAAATEAEAKQ